MPSREHESPLALVDLEPGVLTWLLGEVAGAVVPAHARVGPYPTEARSRAVSVYHSDGVRVLFDERGEPVLGIVFEVQRDFRPEKLRVWALYLARVQVDLNVPAVLVVYAPDPAIADRYRAAAAAAHTAGSLRVDPVVISAAQIPLLVEGAAPGVALMGALAHADDPDIDRVFPALLAGLASMPERHQQAYHDIVLSGLREHARTRWREFMSATDYFRNNYRRTGTPYLSEEFSTAWTEGRNEGRTEGRDEGRAEGRDEGRAEGMARSLVKVLVARGVPLTDTARARIEHETDTGLLEIWLDRALTATTIEDVLTR